MLPPVHQTLTRPEPNEQSMVPILISELLLGWRYRFPNVNPRREGKNRMKLRSRGHKQTAEVGRRRFTPMYPRDIRVIGGFNLSTVLSSNQSRE